MTTLQPPPPSGPEGSPSRQPTNAYTSGLPAPPRILIPPPYMDPVNHSRFAPAPANVLTADPVLPGTLQDWKYEQRRDAQQLLPHLFLGPLSSAKDAGFLKSAGITQLLAVRSSMTARARLLAKQIPGIRYESIDVGISTDLISQFARASEIIDEHYLSTVPQVRVMVLGVPMDGKMLREVLNHGAPHGAKTLVFCESGNERSAAVVAAYLMQHLQISAVHAIQIVQGKRFCVSFDDAAKWMLSSYEPIWTARRQSECSGARQNESGGARQKRRMEEDSDGEGPDNANPGYAPFLDPESEDTLMT